VRTLVEAFVIRGEILTRAVKLNVSNTLLGLGLRVLHALWESEKLDGF
jgi:hypothetical protein